MSEKVPEWAAKLLLQQDSMIQNLMETQAKLFEKNDVLVQKHDEMMGVVSALAKSVAALTEEIAKMMKAQNSPPKETTNGQENGSSPDLLKSMTYSAVVQARLDAATIDEKSKNFVIMNFPEVDENESLLQNEDKLVHEIIQAVGDPNLIKKLNEDRIKYKRHPQDKAPTKRGRPLKIFLESQAERDLVLGYLRRHKTPLLRQNHHTYCRRDYTRHELEVDRDLRKRAGTLNATYGELRYVVRDLQIFTLSAPHPLPKTTDGNLAIRPVKPKAKHS